MLRNLFSFKKSSKREAEPKQEEQVSKPEAEQPAQVEWTVAGQSIRQRVNARRPVSVDEPTGFSSLGATFSKSVPFNENLGDRAARLKHNAACADNFDSFDAMINPQYAPMSEVFFTHGPSLVPLPSDNTQQLCPELDEICAAKPANEQILIEEIRLIAAKLRAIRSGVGLEPQNSQWYVSNEAQEKMCISWLKRYAAESETPQSVLRELAAINEADIDCTLAVNPSIPLDSMWMLARSENARTRQLMAENHSVPLEILEDLTHDGNPQIVNRAHRTIAAVHGTADIVNFPQRVKQADRHSVNF